MAFCSQCGAKIEDGAKFCEVCGAPVENNADEKKAEPSKAVIPGKKPNGNQRAGANDFTSKFGKYFAYSDTTASYSPEDIERNRLVALLSYLGILVLVPWLAVKESPFTQYHVKLGLNLLLWNLVWNFGQMVISGLLGWIPVIGTLLSLVLWIPAAALWGVGIFGIVNAAQGKARELEILKPLKFMH